MYSEAYTFRDAKADTLNIGFQMIIQKRQSKSFGSCLSSGVGLKLC